MKKHFFLRIFDVRQCLFSSLTGDVDRLLREKRKQFKKDVNASFRSLNENLQGILKAQQNSR